MAGIWYTGADELVRLRASRRHWERTLRRARWLARMPGLRAYGLKRWQQAWRELWHRDHVEQVIVRAGSANLSGMDYALLELSVPLAPDHVQAKP